MSTPGIGMGRLPPLRSEPATTWGESQKQKLVDVSFTQCLRCWYSDCRHAHPFWSTCFVLGNNNAHGYRGRKWAAPPDRPWEDSVWERRRGHVPAHHTLFSWRPAEHQVVARQLWRTPCMVRIRGNSLYQLCSSLYFCAQWIVSFVVCRYVSKVMVQDLQSGQKWHFLSNSWLAVDVGDCTLDKVFPVATEMDLKRFRWDLP